MQMKNMLPAPDTCVENLDKHSWSFEEDAEGIPDNDFDHLAGFLQEEDVEEDRGLDQVFCTGCGRPMIVWADAVMPSTECPQCTRGLTPEWEY